MYKNITLSNLILKFVKQNKLLLSCYTLFVIGLIIERIIFPHYYGKIIDNIAKVKPSQIFNVSKKYIIIVVILLIVLQSMFSFTDFIDSIVIPKIQTFFRDSVIYNIIDTFKENYKELEIGDIIAKIIKLPITIKDIFHQFKNYIFSAIITVIFTVIYFFMIDKKLSILTLIILIIYTGCLVYIGKRCIPGSIKRDNYHNQLHEQISDTFNNLMPMYSFNNIKKEQLRINKFTNSLDKQYTTSLVCSLNFKIVYSTLYVFVFLIINGYAFYLTYNKKIKIGQLVSILFIITYLLGDLLSCASEIKDFLYNIGVLKLSQTYLDNLINKYKNNNKPKISHFKFTRGNIEFRNISFGYIKNQLILKNFNLIIPAKQTIALMGNIGSGKSTITKLLLKFYIPTSGQIYIDNLNIQNLSADLVRQKIAYIPQNTKLFNRSIYENIIYGSYKSKKEIVKIIKELHLNLVFKDVENSFDKLAGKNGEDLSGGQRQIICFLRVLINIEKYSIIIFDEPTSALDDQSKKYIMKIIKLISKQKTCIIICHDDELISLVDRCIYLQNGQITKDYKVK